MWGDQDGKFGTSYELDGGSWGGGGGGREGGGGMRSGRRYLDMVKRLNYMKLHKITNNKTFNCTILFDREDELTESVQW